MERQPPKKALAFLRWFCRPDYLEEIEGNLIELFERERAGKQANRHFYWNVLRHFRPAYLRSFSMNPLHHFHMYPHYFKIAWRSMLRQKLYAFINIAGLAVGLSCFLLILLYIQHELSYDRFYPNADQVYRIYQRQEGNTFLGSDYFAVMPPGLAGVLQRECPEVSAATSLVERSALVGHQRENYWEQGLMADPQFFTVFPFTFIQGDPRTALEKAGNIVLTESLAKKLFGNADPLGRTVRYQDAENYTVSGVLADPPSNISFKFSFISALLADEYYRQEINAAKWSNNSVHTFLRLSELADPDQLRAKLPALYQKYTGADENYSFRNTYYIQPLAELHLETKANFDIGLKGNPRYISIFSLIAVLILALACINYMNLAIARSIKRAREVGLRKVIGARRRQLIGQFIGESILIALLALVLAVGLSYLLAPLFSYLLERPIGLNFADNLYLAPLLLALVLVVGIVSGSYPALFMSSLRPVQVFQGKPAARSGGMRLRQWLIVVQYATSIVLIISSMVIYQQFQFIQTKDIGYDREFVVTIPVRDQRVREHIEALETEWLKHPGILAVTTSVALPTNIDASTLVKLGGDDQQPENSLAIYRTDVGHQFLEVFGIQLVAGRNFSPDFGTDEEEGVIINETAAKALGWTAGEAVGKQLPNNNKQRTILGVVKDFHLHSMHLAIEPLMLHPGMEWFRNISIKVRPDNLPATIAALEAGMKKYSAYPFEYRFLNDEFDQLYQDDRRMGEMFGFFTLLSLFIASLGLFGLAAFMTEQRTKEVGIRKVLGASAESIVALLSRDFLKLVLFGFFLAVPLAWYGMHRWLQDFAYRIEISWWVFAAAGLAAMLLAGLTISTQSLKAVYANPVEALKNE